MRDGFKLLLLWGDSIDHIPSNEAKILTDKPQRGKKCNPFFLPLIWAEFEAGFWVLLILETLLTTLTAK